LLEYPTIDSRIDRMPPSSRSAAYGSAPPSGTTSKARWKIACASISPRAAVSWRLSLVSVARWYALSTATTTTTSVVTPATCLALMDTAADLRVIAQDPAS
jgi:hypothetical protein